MSVRENAARAGYVAGMKAMSKHKRRPIEVLPWEETIPEQRVMFYAIVDAVIAEINAKKSGS